MVHLSFILNLCFSDTSVANLKYLNHDQALADLEAFILDITRNNHELSKAKWVVFGGSYAGILATLSRMKYPNLIYAAVTSGSPTYGTINFAGGLSFY